jgi:hypothetical protein
MENNLLNKVITQISVWDFPIFILFIVSFTRRSNKKMKGKGSNFFLGGGGVEDVNHGDA